MAVDNERTPMKAWLLLSILFLGYACSAADREIISLLVEPIKRDLSFSDTQIGLLQGVAFLAFYSIAGIPAGMLVDRRPRMKLLAVALSLWSFMTAFCGMARTFTLLFIARAGVGVGETFLSPAALSLISDVFPKRRHGFAIGIYVGGSLVGSSIAVGFGGLLYGWLAPRGAVNLPLLGHLEPWQMTFILVGLPGFLIAAAFLLTAEPPRLGAPSQPGSGGVREFYREHWRFISFHHAANGFTNLLAGGVTAWGASYLIRTFGSDVESVGPLLGFAFLIGGIAGMIGGGVLSDKLLRYGGSARLWMCGGCAALGALAALFLPSVDSVYAGAFLIGLIVMFGSVPYSVANAALQEIVPSGIRGTVSAIYYFTISVLGSIGPSAIAFVTDKVFADPARLSESLSIVVTTAFLVSMILYLLAIRPYRLVGQRGVV
ncbi:MFS transporter [Sphingomonas oligophenolica]|uniref:MFS transporter n=1 Tax=Sphingomonas oligophenolica TaxID=301154 RepID=A0ABU9YB19_9SPHN